MTSEHVRMTELTNTKTLSLLSHIKVTQFPVCKGKGTTQPHSYSVIYFVFLQVTHGACLCADVFGEPTAVWRGCF